MIIARSLFTRMAFDDAGAADRLLRRAIDTAPYSPAHWDTPGVTNRRRWSFGKLW